MKRTESQQAAIDVNYGNVVVTASAGSGKTRVMIDRFIRLVLERRTEVDRVLAVTFTRLAAAEMRERLLKAIRAEIAAGKDDGYLKEQFYKLNNANICTIDSFCNTVVKRYFYLVDADPAFVIADQDRSEDLKNRAINDLFAEKYENNDGDFLFLVRVFLSKRKDAELKKIVLKIAEFTETEADEESFFYSALSLYTEEGLKSAENQVIAEFINLIKDMKSDIEERKKELLENRSDKYIRFIDSLCLSLNSFLNEPSEDALKAALKFDKKPAKSKADTEAERSFSDYYSDVFKKRAGKISELIEKLFPDEKGDRLEKTLKTRSIAEKLFSLVKEFKAYYFKEKTERGVLDYADVERLAYRILQKEEAAAEIKSSFDYVFIDEFQDVNALQNAIFSLITDDNAFIVGDVKQSIYGFRGSDPDILTKYAFDGVMKSVDLAENFRSAPAVIEAVNKIFCRVMDGGADIDYKKAPMIYGGLYPLERGVARMAYVEKEEKQNIDSPKVYSVLKDVEEKADKLFGGRRALVKKLIEENVGTSFYDKDGKKRILSFGDILIVSRTNRYEDVISELIRSGIPVVSESDFAVTDYYEINLAVDILTTLYASCKDDAALVSALKCRMGGLDNGDLAEIVSAYPKEEFHNAVLKYSTEKGGDLADKLRRFFAYVKKLSLLTAVEGCGKILTRAIKDNYLFAEISAMPCGRARKARLERFVASLSAGDEDISLNEFFKRKDVLLKKKMPSVVSGGDSVKIMTAHKSKGLEAPMVIVIGANYDMHRANSRQTVFLDRKFGIGLDHYDVENKIKEPSFLKSFVGEMIRKSTVLEEKRLLYVALTRAEVKLFVVTEAEPPAQAVKRPNAILDFFLSGDLDYSVYKREDIVSDTFISAKPLVFPAFDKSVADTVRKAVEYEYPYANDLSLSLKRSVTDVNALIKNKDLAADEADETPAKPVVNSAGDVESGLTYHRFLERCSLQADKVEEDILSLENSGALNGGEATRLDANKLKRILSLDIFSKIRGWDVYREKAFTVNVSPDAVGEKGGANVLLQGVVDMFAVKDGKAIIVDYKYSGLGDAKLSEKYYKQLSLYAYAIEKCLGVTIEGAYLINLLTESVITVKV